MKVKKKSRKPFKSGSKINTVKGSCVNTQDPKKRPAFSFDEDDSIVNQELCEEVKNPVLKEKTMIKRIDQFGELRF